MKAPVSNIHVSSTGDINSRTTDVKKKGTINSQTDSRQESKPQLLSQSLVLNNFNSLLAGRSHFTFLIDISTNEENKKQLLVPIIN